MESAWKVFDDLVTETKENERKERGGSKNDTQLQIESLVSNWRMYLSEEYGNTSVDNDHRCTTRECVATESISVISDLLNLYGCNKSGKYHVCRMGTASQDGCIPFLNHESVRICLFSGRELGASYICERDYSRPKCNIEENFSFDNDNDNENLDQMEIEENPFVSEGEIDETGVAFHFQSDNNNIYVPNQRTRDRPIDKRRSVKRANASQKTRKESLNVSFEDVENPFSIANKFSSNFRWYSRGIINDLLFNSSERERINALHYQEMKRNADNALRKEVKICNSRGIVPTLLHMEAKYRFYMQEKKNLAKLKPNSDIQNYYSDICLALWIFIIHSRFYSEKKPAMHVQSHVLGILYASRRGYSITRGEDREYLVLCKDKILGSHLPNQSDLKEWNSTGTHYPRRYNKSEITMGENNIRESVMGSNSEEIDLLCISLYRIRQKYKFYH